MENKNKKTALSSIQMQKFNIFSVLKKTIIKQKKIEYNNHYLETKSTLNLTVFDEDVFIALLYLCVKNGREIKIIDEEDESKLDKYKSKIKLKYTIYEVVKTIKKANNKDNYEAVKKSIIKLSKMTILYWFKEDSTEFNFIVPFIETISENKTFYLFLNPFYSELILTGKGVYFINLEERFILKNAYAKKLYTYFLSFKFSEKAFKEETLLKHCLSLNADDDLKKYCTAEQIKQYKKQLKKGIQELNEKGLFNITKEKELFYISKT